MSQKIKDLIFTHFVIVTDGTVLASARDKCDRVQNFLISRQGSVQRQVNARFEPVSPQDADTIRKAAQKYYSLTPLYRTKAVYLI